MVVPASWLLFIVYSYPSHHAKLQTSLKVSLFCLLAFGGVRAEVEPWFGWDERRVVAIDLGFLCHVSSTRGKIKTVSWCPKGFGYFLYDTNHKRAQSLPQRLNYSTTNTYKYTSLTKQSKERQVSILKSKDEKRKKGDKGKGQDF